MKHKSNKRTLIRSFVLTVVFHFTLLLSTPQATDAHQFSLSTTGFIPHLGRHNDAAFINQPQTQAKASAHAPSSQEIQAASAAPGVTTKSRHTGADTIGLVSSGSDFAVQSLPGKTSQTPTADSTSQSSSPGSISNMKHSPSQSLPGSRTYKPGTSLIAQLSQVNPLKVPASIPASKREEHDMKGVCHSTDYPDVCISSIAPLLSGKPNVISMLQMSIKACAAETKLATAFAQKLVSSSTTNTMNDQGISVCEENYIDILDNLKSASDAIPSRDVGTINSMLSAVISDLSTCEDGFDGSPSPMMQFYGKLKKMASNCLAIATLVK